MKEGKAGDGRFSDFPAKIYKWGCDCLTRQSGAPMLVECGLAQGAPPRGTVVSARERRERHVHMRQICTNVVIL